MEQNDVKPHTLRIAGRSQETQIKAQRTGIIPNKLEVLSNVPFQRSSNSSIRGLR